MHFYPFLLLLDLLLFLMRWLTIRGVRIRTPKPPKWKDCHFLLFIYFLIRSINWIQQWFGRVSSTQFDRLLVVFFKQKNTTVAAKLPLYVIVIYNQFNRWVDETGLLLSPLPLSQRKLIGSDRKRSFLPPQTLSLCLYSTATHLQDVNREGGKAEGVDTADTAQISCNCKQPLTNFHISKWPCISPWELRLTN